MAIGYAIVFSGATLVVDGWRRIHQARRETRLVTDGVYARVRHPQYTGLFLIVFGEGIVHWPTHVHSPPRRRTAAGGQMSAQTVTIISGVLLLAVFALVAWNRRRR